jgi:GntR family transcriptional regulator
MNDNPQPRYVEIADYVRNLITDAEPGDRLPSDAELCERFDVSRMTARHAMQILTNEGLLRRQRGQGTFVTAGRVTRLLGSPLSFSEGMRRRGAVPSSHLLTSGEVVPTTAEAAELHLEDGEPAVVLERLRLADGVPMAIERVVMPTALGAVLGEDLETGSLHSAFERLGRIPTQALAEVSARRVTAREGRLLDLPPSGVVISERRTIFDEDGTPLEATVTCYAADRYRLQAVLHRDDSEAAS